MQECSAEEVEMCALQSAELDMTDMFLFHISLILALWLPHESLTLNSEIIIELL